MYYIEIYDSSSKRTWTENFDSYYLFRKRVIKLNHSSKLFIIARSNLEE